MIILDDIRLPEKWSKGSAGGPEFKTADVPVASGDVYVQQLWINPLQRYEIAHNIKTKDQIAELNVFFRGRRGKKRGFLLRDWLDFSSREDGDSRPGRPISMLDQPLGEGDGVETTFQLIKRYDDPVNPYDRTIKWPVAASVLIALDGVAVAGADFAVDRGTGVVTFAVAPADNAVITAGYEFDVPVRFTEDWLSVSWDSINSSSIGSVPLEEVRAWLA